LALSGNLELAILDLGLDLPGVLTIDGATDGEGSAENGENSSLGGSGHRLEVDVLGDLQDLSEVNVAVVLHVLDFLAVTRGLLQGADQIGSSAGGDIDLSNTVLDGELAGDLETLPLLGGLLDILTDLLGIETKGTDLWGKGSGGRYFSSDGADDDDLLLIGVEFRGHIGFSIRTKFHQNKMYSLHKPRGGKLKERKTLQITLTR
jgi:hypothetical protein